MVPRVQVSRMRRASGELSACTQAAPRLGAPPGRGPAGSARRDRDREQRPPREALAERAAPHGAHAAAPVSPPPHRARRRALLAELLKDDPLEAGPAHEDEVDVEIPRQLAQDSAFFFA